MAIIDRVQVMASTYTVAIPYETCSTAAGTAAKVVALTGFTLGTGAQIRIKFTEANTASNPTLNVNSTGAKNIYLYGTTAASTSTSTTGWYAGSVVMLTYDGTGWIRDQGFNTNDNTYPSAYCSTASATAAKVATCSGYVLTNNTYLHLILTNANSSATAITLNVNSKGAKTIAINGTASSTTNYTLPAGSYLTYYDGTYYHIRTDGKLPASISGDASTVGGHTVGVNVPSNAKFTDTTYSDVTTTAHGLMTATDKVKLNGIATGAEVNQNAYSVIHVGSTSINAEHKTDTLTLEAGSNVTLTPDDSNHKVTITATDTTYSDATTSAHGLMTAADKTKLDNIMSSVYPVGCIYHSTSSTNPGNASVFGFGTWVEIKITATWDTLKSGVTSYTDGATTGTVHTFRRTA